MAGLFGKSLIGAMAMIVGSSVSAADEAPRPKYEAGQVWAYKTRPQDKGSLLKIQLVEPYGNDRVYHISIVGLKIGGPYPQTLLQHIPVSKETLDKSVTKRERGVVDVPEYIEGVATWKEQQGGVFTLSVADIVDTVEQSLQ